MYGNNIKTFSRKNVNEARVADFDQACGEYSFGAVSPSGLALQVKEHRGLVLTITA